MKPTPQEAAELGMLRNNSTLTTYLEKGLTAVTESLVTLQDQSQLRVQQGKAQVLRDLLKVIRGV